MLRRRPNGSCHVSDNHPHRPAGVTALACFFVFGVLASGLSFISLLTPGGPLEPMWQVNPRAHQAFTRLGGWAALLLGIVCVACAASAFSFFTGKRWGCRLGAVLLLLNLACDIVNAALGAEPRALAGIPVVVAILWYLSRPQVRTFFGARSQVAKSMAADHEETT